MIGDFQNGGNFPSVPSFLDKYAKNAREWREGGDINYRASMYLFASGDPFLYFPAAVLGHHSLEMHLKAILISDGMVAFNPKAVNRLDPALSLTKTDCVWGHNLVVLAEMLAARKTDFDLTASFVVPSAVLKMPMTVKEGLEIFDPFFSELRYPTELKLVQGLGEDHGHVLDALVGCLRPFLDKIQ